MYAYDIHVATEHGPGRDKLHESLLALSFKDDALAERGLIFDQRTAQHYAACPLIDLHMSRKIVDMPELKKVEREVDHAMHIAEVPGYWHSEYIEWDARIAPSTDRPLHLRPFFCQPLESRPREAQKEWDLHLCFRETDLPDQLRDWLVDSGLYYLARFKTREGMPERYAVFTVQGVNHPKEGHRFCKELVFWLGLVGAPACDLKLEITTRMHTYCQPQLVPPTIDTIQWRY